MSGEVRFRIVKSTGSDPGHEATELETKSKSTRTKGWQSCRFPEYPQKLVLKLVGGVHDVRKLQILSHESKIPSSIEVYCGNRSVDSIIWEKLGYLSLDDNQRSQFKARELKSVYVNARGEFLKLVIKQNHVNAINLFNQVGIVAVNVVGAVAGSGAPPGGRVGALEVDTKLDPKTMDMLHRLQRRKEHALKMEDYDEAKRLKSQMVRLEQAGALITDLEHKKVEAVHNEDYDEAKRIKREIDRLRDGGYSRGGSGRRSRRDERDYNNHSRQRSARRVRTPQDDFDEKPVGGGKNTPLQVFQNDPVDPLVMDPMERPLGGGNKMNGGFGAEFPEDQPLNNGGGADERPIGGGKKPRSPPPEMDRPLNVESGPGDERAIKATSAFAGGGGAAADHPDPFGDGGGAASGQGAAGAGEPEKIKPGDQKLADELMEVWDERRVRCLFSKQWVLREQALSKIKEDVEGNHVDKDQNTLFGSLCKVVKLGLSDRVAKAFEKSRDVLTLTVDRYGKVESGERQTSSLAPIIDNLLSTLANPNARMRQQASEMLSFLSKHNDVETTAVTSRLFKMKKTDSKPFALRGRAALMGELVEVHKIGKVMYLDDIMTFATPHFEHRDKPVRDALVELMVTCYKNGGAKKLSPALKGLQPRVREAIMGKMPDGAAAEMGIRPEAKAAPKAAPPKRSAGSAEATNKPVKKAAAGKKDNKAASKPEPKSHKPVHHDDDNGQENSVGSLAGYCQFCGLEDPSFTEERLDLHYWQDCVMLTNCKQCEQVIEIPTLNEHLLDPSECEGKGSFKQCPRCKEAIPSAQFDAHVKKGKCLPYEDPSKFNRCPLCHKNIPPGEDGWKVHLLEQGCPANPRKRK